MAGRRGAAARLHPPVRGPRTNDENASYSKRSAELSSWSLELSFGYVMKPVLLLTAERQRSRASKKSVNFPAEMTSAAHFERRAICSICCPLQEASQLRGARPPARADGLHPACLRLPGATSFVSGKHFSVFCSPSSRDDSFSFVVVFMRLFRLWCFGFSFRLWRRLPGGRPAAPDIHLLQYPSEGCRLCHCASHSKPPATLAMCSSALAMS